MMGEKNTAIILAGGQGRRMNSFIPKQFLLLKDKPVLFYAMEVFEKSDLIHEIILVTEENRIEYCQREIVEKYCFNKVSAIVKGGSERYLSVYNGIKAVQSAENIFIHDGARPFVTEDIIERAYESVRVNEACVAAMPVKDTIKITDEKKFVKETPERSNLWIVQTPQVFRKCIIEEAYNKLIASGNRNVTDDAMVVEEMLQMKVKLVEGSYKNIKITTPEDLLIGQVYLENS